MSQLKQTHEARAENLAKGHGQFREIAQDEFLPEVTGSSRVVAHFYHNDFQRCKVCYILYTHVYVYTLSCTVSCNVQRNCVHCSSITVSYMFMFSVLRSKARRHSVLRILSTVVVLNCYCVLQLPFVQIMDMHIGRIAPAHIECKFIKVSTNVIHLIDYVNALVYAPSCSICL